MSMGDDRAFSIREPPKVLLQTADAMHARIVAFLLEVMECMCFDSRARLNRVAVGEVCTMEAE